METLRKRVPFKFTDSPLEIDEDNGRILDEQEQEELIRSLREENVLSNERYLIFLRVVLGLSFLLQLVSLLNSPHENPLLAIFPANLPEEIPSIPYPVIATLLSLTIHINLAALAFSGDSQTRVRFGDFDVHPIPYQLLYVISAVAPTLSLFLRRSWQSTAWWSLTAAVVFTVHTVTGSIDRGNESIAELETMKYVAPGA